LLLGGCVQGPDYAKPRVEVPSAYRTPVQPDAETTHELWWNGFGDPRLSALVSEALANNRDLRVATARVDEFAAILAGTKSQASPQVGYDLSGERARASEKKIPNFVDPLSTTFASILSASWELDLWGRIRRETEAAQANLLASEEARRGVTLTLIASVVTSYVTLLDLDEQLRVTDQTIAGRKKSVELFETRLAGGWISEFEMSQVRAEYEAAVAQRPSILQAIATQENALSVLVGHNPTAIARSPSLESLHSPVVPAGLPSDLLNRRPDILQAEQQLVASNALIGVARAQYFPRISLTGLFGFASPSLGGLFSGGLKAAVQQAEARREQSLASYELVVQNAFRDVDDALADVQHSAELRDTLERRVATLKRSVELATERYENGYSDYLELLDAERSLFNAQLQLASARGDYNRALVDLYRALGGDWNAIPPVAPQTAAARR
jgi:multidrug efflux system outer membrane protein